MENNKKPIIRKIHIQSFISLLEKLYQDGNDFFDIQMMYSTNNVDNIRIITREEYRIMPDDDDDDDNDDESLKEDRDIYLNMVHGISGQKEDDVEEDEEGDKDNFMDRA